MACVFLPGGRRNPSVTSRCGSLRPSIHADVRYIDDVIAIEGLSTADRQRGCGFHTDGACRSDQIAHVEAACVGKQSCSIHVGNSFAGTDPCIGNNQKHLTVVAECSGSGAFLT